MTKFSFLCGEEGNVHLSGLRLSQLLSNRDLSGSWKIQALFIFNSTIKNYTLYYLIFFTHFLKAKLNI